MKADTSVIEPVAIPKVVSSPVVEHGKYLARRTIAKFAW